MCVPVVVSSVLARGGRAMSVIKPVRPTSKSMTLIKMVNELPCPAAASPTRTVAIVPGADPTIVAKVKGSALIDDRAHT